MKIINKKQVNTILSVDHEYTRVLQTNTNLIKSYLTFIFNVILLLLFKVLNSIYIYSTDLSQFSPIMTIIVNIYIFLILYLILYFVYAQLFKQIVY